MAGCFIRRLYSPMAQGLTIELWLLIGGAFLFLAVIASVASARLNIPALVLFIGLGLLAGSEGPGGLAFENYGLARTVGTIALGFILFAGGLDSHWRDLKPVLWKGFSLATLGTFITAIVIGYAAHLLAGFTFLEGMLLGAVVCSTDAAAVFGVLRGRGIALKHRITPTLELESGANDPIAVFLTLALTAILSGAGTDWVMVVPQLAQELIVGALVGIVTGMFGVWTINHLKLEYDGLYPALTIGVVCLAFGGADLLHGSEFLSVYAAGLFMGSRNFLHRIALLQFHDGLAWLFQILMFVMLGLLAFPSRVIQVAGAGLLLSAVLMFVARPLAVFISLSLARMAIRSKLFVSWAGLRGAVPIILAIFPLMAGVEKGETIFNIVFFVVITSVLLQGTTLGLAAKWLHVVGTRVRSSPDLKPATGEMLELVLEPDSPVVRKQVVELNLPNTALLLLLERDGRSYIPRGATVLHAGDRLIIATRKEDHEELRAKFLGSSPTLFDVGSEQR